MRNSIINEVNQLENVIFVCFGRPVGDELPQVESADDVMINLVCESTGKSLNLVDAEFHHQTEMTED